MGKKVLVVDDEKLIVKGIRFSLEQDGMEVDTAYDGEEGLAAARRNDYDIVLLDVMLPKMNGFEVCQQIREFSDMPIIMLTAKGDDMDKILGLEYGADDYITKPFKMPILHRRIQAALRKNGAKDERHLYDDGYLKIDFDRLTATLAGNPLSMTPTEYKIVRLLTADPDKVMTKRLLLEKIWDNSGNFVDEHAVAVNINRLRKKIESDGHEYIKTLYGMGYQWKKYY